MREPLTPEEQASIRFSLDDDFGAVFANPRAKALVLRMKRMGRDSITFAEIAEHLSRCRVKWGDLS